MTTSAAAELATAEAAYAAATAPGGPDTPRRPLEASLAFLIATRLRRVVTGRHEYATGELGRTQEWTDPETGGKGFVCYSWHDDGYEYDSAGEQPERAQEAAIRSRAPSHLIESLGIPTKGRF
jgi:hypothetical protein